MVCRFLFGCLTALILHSSASAEKLRFKVEWFEWDKPTSEETSTPDTWPPKLTPKIKPRASLTVSVRAGEPSATTARFGDESLRFHLLASKKDDNCVHVETEIEHVKFDREHGLHANGKFYPGRSTDRTNSTVVLKRGERFVLGDSQRKVTDKNGREREWYSAFAITAIKPKKPKTDHPSVPQTDQTPSPSK